METDAAHARFVAAMKEFDDIHDLIRDRLQLAHYTSIGNLESIMRNGEFWLSNPLFMNDLQEMRFGINQGLHIITTDKIVDEMCGSMTRARLIREGVRQHYDQFDAHHALDVYVFCLSEHPHGDNDGLLSMWRGYGGQGSGAALIFDTGFLRVHPESPLILTKVKYLNDERKAAFLDGKIREILTLMRDLDLRDDQLFLVNYHLFALIKIFALSFKHDGFKEENEWRMIYLPDRDPNGILKGYLHYHIGPRGVEPKLKLRIQPLPGSENEWDFAGIVTKIILGPTASSPLSAASTRRMLEAVGRPEFTSKVVASSIPLRG